MVSPFGLLSARSVVEWQATSSPFIRRQEKEVETKKKMANGRIKNESGFLCFHSTWRIMGVFQWASGCVFSHLFLVVSLATGEFFGGGSTPIQLYIEGYFKGTVSPLWPLSCAWCCSPWHSRERMERETLQDWSPSVLGSGTVRRNAMQTSHVIWKDIGMACILAKMWCTLHKKRQMKPSEWNYWMETPWRR